MRILRGKVARQEVGQGEPVNFLNTALESGVNKVLYTLKILLGNSFCCLHWVVSRISSSEKNGSLGPIAPVIQVNIVFTRTSKPTKYFFYQILLLAKKGILGRNMASSGFPLSSKTNISKFQFDLEFCVGFDTAQFECHRLTVARLLGVTLMLNKVDFYSFNIYLFINILHKSNANLVFSLHTNKGAF